MNTQDEKQDTAQTAAYNPFPEPQTIPSGWDPCVLFTKPEPIIEQRQDADTEN